MYRPPLPEGPFDLVVVGGGINGAGIARDAVMRGRSVALLEKGDFAGGTSSATSKMVHGGIRYLEHFQLGLVQEALRERSTLLRIAPHLVRPQSFLLPVYAGGRRSLRVVRFGLRLYDWLALGRRLAPAEVVGAAEVAARIPGIREAGLAGAVVYHDAVMDDARLCLANAIAAREEAGKRSTPFFARNYTAVVAEQPTTPIRLEIEDRACGRRQPVLAHRVVRALGPWSPPQWLVPSKGVHIVLSRLPLADGLVIEHSRDGRVFFVVPWGEFSVVGTTETPFEGSPDSLSVEDEEVDYLLGELQSILPGERITKRAIAGAFAGVRPLARSGGILARLLGRSPGTVSRRHRIYEDGRGILTVVGGKYTTYRVVAEEVVDRLFGAPACRTHREPLPGGEEGDWESFRAALRGEEIERHGEAEIGRLFRRYGARLRDVLRLVEEDPGLGQPLAPGCRELRAEVVYAKRCELAVYPADFLDRRTHLSLAAGGDRALYAAVEELLTLPGEPAPAGLDEARSAWFEARRRMDRLRGVAAEAAPAADGGPDAPAS